ncbi:MAG: KAP family NTPase [Planctomycetes bacterium]|nr:KAP family NTPase [Planctomycetota bacterium]
MWSDHETDQDFLGFTHLIKAVTDVVSRDDLLPATIGVYGDWGGGKSSLLKMVAADLSSREGFLVLQVNGWLFEGYDDAKTALMETILDEIASKKKLTAKGRGLFVRLIRRVNWLRVLGKGIKYGAGFLVAGPPGLGAVAAMDARELLKQAAEKISEVDEEKVKELLKEPEQEVRRGVREFREDFKQLLAESDIKTLVVIIDDLDRCLPDTIIETLEAIKLFLFVPRTAFLLGADERLVKYAVRRRFPEFPGERAEVGRDYLEKLVQFAVRVPSLSRAEIETYIGLLFAKNCSVNDDGMKKACSWALGTESISQGRVFNLGAAKSLIGGTSLPAGLEDALTLSARIGPVLAMGLNGNPRQCKRFLNTLIMRLSMAKSRSIELKQSVLAKLMLLEYFRPESFRRLAKLQGESDGKPKQLRLAEERNVEDKTETSVAAASKSDNKATGARPATAANRSESEALNPEMETWLSDDWLKVWLGMQPLLASEDLRPYFYFSRDQLGVLAGAAQRLSPSAQEALRQLLQESDAIRKLALKRAKELSSADAAAVFEELATRVRQSEDLSDENSPLRRLFDWVEARTELSAQLVLAVRSLSEATLPVWTVTGLQNACKGNNGDSSANQLIQQWANSSENGKLKVCARPSTSHS